MRNNILFIHAGAELYGSDRNILRAVIALSEVGNNCILLVPQTGPLIEKAKKNNIRYIVESYPILRRNTINPLILIKYLFSYFFAIHRINKIIKKYKINIIHSNTIVVMLGAYFFKKLDITHVWHIRETIWKPRLVRSILYMIVKHRSDYIICVSKAVQNAIGLCSKSIVIHNGINPILKNIDLQRTLLAKKEYTVGTLGRFNAIKGQIQIAKAAKYVNGFYNKSKIHYIFAGGVFGNNTYWLDNFKHFVTQHQLTKFVTIHGFITDVKQFYSKLDLFILPSTSPDSFPTVVLESISAGVPVIGYRNGGIEEILNNDENCLVELGNFKALGDAIVRLLSDSELRYKIVKKQRARFDKYYNLESFKKNLILFYNNINTCNST